MHAEALRLTRLLDDLARLADAEQPGLLLDKQPLDLAEVAGAGRRWRHSSCFRRSPGLRRHRARGVAPVPAPDPSALQDMAGTGDRSHGDGGDVPTLIVRHRAADHRQRRRRQAARNRAAGRPRGASRQVAAGDPLIRRQRAAEQPEYERRNDQPPDERLSYLRCSGQPTIRMRPCAASAIVLIPRASAGSAGF